MPIPCRYKTGKTLRKDRYTLVREAVEIKTGTYYACKVIKKTFTKNEALAIKNEISILKVSGLHRNIITLHDYFETVENVYLCFDLCTGGDLFDRVHYYTRGKYHEKDAANLVKTIFGAVAWLHASGIIHRDLRPENIAFKDDSRNADVMIWDFGISEVIDSGNAILTRTYGTTPYTAPEAFLGTCYHKPVDVWAMGVITYFILCGCTPFDWDSEAKEENAAIEAIVAGDYEFELIEHWENECWENFSETAKDFILRCLTVNPTKRPSAQDMLEHKWLSGNLQCFNAKRTFRKTVFVVIAIKRMTTLTSLSPGPGDFDHDLQRYKEGSKEEVMDENEKVSYHNGSDEDGGGTRVFSKQTQEVLSAEVTKLSINDMPKAG